MRIDHHAYQRATQVAAFGLLLQLIIGISLLVFGLMSPTASELVGTQGDTAFQYSGIYALCGVPVWLALIILFYQHRAERLEALEQDESGRSDVSSIFDIAAADSQVAARRLRIMYKWLMPLISLLLAALLAGLGAWMWWRMSRLGAVDDGTDFLTTRHVGWAVAICLSFALVGFIFSRFVAGMAKLAVWQNLRGGASYIVGTALVMLAIAAGVTFRFFDNNAVIEVIIRVLPIFMWLQAGEIVLNFILNLYRPRVPGELPRPAFDSKILSLLAAPDSLVRSMNEAVNYQFGFDVTSTWGYQLLLRSFVWLVGLGFIALVLLNCMVIVEPHEQAVKLAGGRIVGDRVYDSGVMWKLPWPFQTAKRVSVGRIREVPLTATRITPPRRNYFAWGEQNLNAQYNVDLQPFIVSASHLLDQEDITEQLQDLEAAEVVLEDTAIGDQQLPDEDDAQTQRVANLYSLVDAEIVLQYRIKREDNGLLEFLQFSSDERSARRRLTDRERALRSLALSVVSEKLVSMSLDEVVSFGRDELAATLVDEIQSRFDDAATGVEVVAINFPMIRPSGDTAAESFEEIGIAKQNTRLVMAQVQRDRARLFMSTVGRTDLVPEIMTLLDEYDALKGSTSEANQERLRELKGQIEQLIVDGGGGNAQFIAAAEQLRWNEVMGARARVADLQGQMKSYLASPDLFRKRAVMQAFSDTFSANDVRVYVLGIDPSRIDLGVEWRERDSALNISDVINPETERLETN